MEHGINSIIKTKFPLKDHNISMTIHKVIEDAITIASCYLCILNKNRMLLH